MNQNLKNDMILNNWWFPCINSIGQPKQLLEGTCKRLFRLSFFQSLFGDSICRKRFGLQWLCHVERNGCAWMACMDVYGCTWMSMEHLKLPLTSIIYISSKKSRFFPNKQWLEQGITELIPNSGMISKASPPSAWRSVSASCCSGSSAWSTPYYIIMQEYATSRIQICQVKARTLQSWGKIWNNGFGCYALFLSPVSYLGRCIETPPANSKPTNQTESC